MLPNPDDYNGWKEYAQALNAALSGGSLANLLAEDSQAGPLISSTGVSSITPVGFSPVWMSSDQSALWLGNSNNSPPPAAALFQIDTTHLADAAIEFEKIKAGAVQSSSLADGAVLSAKIADAAILSAKIGDAQIVTAKIADLAVNNGKIANLAVDSGKIANLAVGTAQLQDASITSLKVVDGAIGTTAHLADHTDAAAAQQAFHRKE